MDIYKWMFESPETINWIVYVVDVKSLLTLGSQKLAMNNILAHLQEVGLRDVAS